MRKLATRGALRAHGQGVYTHRDVPTTVLAEPTIAWLSRVKDGTCTVSLCSICLGSGRKVRVGTRRPVRRTLPEWMMLENGPDVPDEDLPHYEGIPATTVRRALEDMRDRMPPPSMERRG